eukprot:9484758-Pyramimonas_sp.AAC.2
MCGESDELSGYTNASWIAYHDRLVAYKRATGTTDVDPEKDKGLYKWTNAQRQAATTFFLNQQQKEALDKLGFNWEKQKRVKTGKRRSIFSCWSSPQVNDNKSAAVVAGRA